jgi:hypothetical protein
MDNEIIAMALRMIGKNICLIADCICKEEETTQPTPEEKPKKKTRKAAKAKDEPAETEPVPEEEKPTITFEQVRAALAQKSRDGYTSAVKNLVERFGAEKLSEIKSEHYAEILKQAEMIGYD